MGKCRIAADSEGARRLPIFIHVQTGDIDVRKLRQQTLERQTCRFASGSAR
jgi:hypothetical protein